MIGPKNAENGLAVGRAMELLAPMGRGETISHEQLERAMGVPRGPRYYGLVKQLKKRMEDERGITLKVCQRVGYTLSTPAEQLGLARFRVVQAARRLRKGVRHADALPPSDCSHHELRIKQAFSDRMAMAERQAREEAMQLSVLMRPRGGTRWAEA